MFTCGCTLYLWGLVSMEQQLQNLQLALFAALIVIIGAVALYIKQSLELRTKNAELELRKENVDIDDTAMKNKLSAEAQRLIQQFVVSQADSIRALQDDLRHQRDLIEQGAKERTKLESDRDQLEKTLNNTLAQQSINVEKLRQMEPHLARLELLTQENAQLKGQVAELRQMIEDADTKADQRHAEMSRITGVNAELDAKLRQATIDLENVRRLLRECQGVVADHEIKHPDLRKLPALTVTGDLPADINKESDHETDSSKG